MLKIHDLLFHNFLKISPDLKGEWTNYGLDAQMM